MNKQETHVIEQCLDTLKGTIVELTLQKTELERRIDELEAVRATLTQLLPTDRRIDRLFS